jgi:hypothetical protein
MTVMLKEQRLGAVRWIVLSGPGNEAFGALGRHMRAEIRAVVSEWDDVARLRQHVAEEPGRGRLAAVSRASEVAFPEVWAELAALADGAGVPLGDLALLNYRGDLGTVGDGGGCSDLAWRRREAFIAHNEDDSEFFGNRSAMLTLALDGQPAVTAFLETWLPAQHHVHGDRNRPDLGHRPPARRGTWPLPRPALHRPGASAVRGHPGPGRRIPA